MHAISSYRGNRPTNTHTNRQDRLHYSAPLSLARSIVITKYTLHVRNNEQMQTDCRGLQ